MIHRTFLAATLLLLAVACGPAPTETPLAPPAAVQRDDDPPSLPDSTTIPADTTKRGGGTIGSGT